MSDVNNILKQIHPAKRLNGLHYLFNQFNYISMSSNEGSHMENKSTVYRNM